MKPISPDEVVKTKRDIFPVAVIAAWNEVIAENWVNNQSHFSQETILTRIMTKMDCTRGTVFSNNWLDAEPIYEAEGWKVVYDKPAYNESYEANFTFSPGKKK